MDIHQVELDTITPSQYSSMCMTLGRPLTARQEDALAPNNSNIDNTPAKQRQQQPVSVLEPLPGTLLPANWHLIYFPQRLQETELASDGYERDWQPPPPFERRVWAGGRLRWWPDNPLRVGDRVQQETRCSSVEAKHGKRGAMALVWTARLLKTIHGSAVQDERCLAYMPTGAATTVDPKVVER
jgi:3-methylfumaryl-CoA hydratase